MKPKSIPPEYAKLFKAILSNLKNSDLPTKDAFEQAYKKFSQDSNEQSLALFKLRDNKQSKEIFDDHFAEFTCWQEGFKNAVRIHKKEKQVENFNIREKLIEIQPKIKSTNPNNSYFIAIMPIAKKQLKFDDAFIKTWKQQKIKVKEDRLKEKAKIKPSTASQQQPQSQSQPQSQLPQQQQQTVQSKIQQNQKTPPPPRLQQKSEKSKLDQVEKPQSSQIPQQINKKKVQNKQVQRQRIKQANEFKVRKIKQARLTNIIKYLESRKQFAFVGPNKQVARQIFNYLNVFMKEKIHSILETSKLRVPGYDSEVAGDQFRFYSAKSQNIQIKHTVMLPESDIKIMKVKYPSKLERYLKLRMQQEKQQQKYKNELKQKSEGDKKGGDKIMQQYVTSDQREATLHEFQHDEGPKKRERLIVPSQVIQYILEQDPWFCDVFPMERTFYRSNG